MDGFSRSSQSEDGRVLIVEDERLSRRALSLLLGGCGYRTTSAGSAEEALDMLGETNPPDIVLVDVDLPGMSGLELVAQLEETRPSIFTVIISAADGDRIDNFLRDHRVAYLRKPLDFDHLLGLLNDVHAH